MTSGSVWRSIADGISDAQVLALEQAAIRIPSTTFKEGRLADYLANYMSDVGLEVEMMEVTHPGKPGKRTRQPIGRLRGTGGGSSLMLNGHMDPGVEMSGWSVDPYGAKFVRNDQMVTPAGSCPAGSPAAPALRASENGIYVSFARQASCWADRNPRDGISYWTSRPRGPTRYTRVRD